MPITIPPIREKVANALHTERTLLREFLAEFLGTFILVLIGDGAVAQWVLSKGTVSSFLTVNFAYALGIAFGIYVAGGVSGGHINPAVSVTFAILGKLKWIKLPVYIVAQHLGAFFASVIIYLAYYDALGAFDNGKRLVVGAGGTAGIWATYPIAPLSTLNGFFDQIVGTAILVSLALAITDPRNMEVPKHLVPLLIGLVVGAIGMSFGYNCGYAINPARDLGPRIFTAIAGWGGEVFTARKHFFWIPIVGPYIGALVGAVLYNGFVGNHWPRPARIVVASAPAEPALEMKNSAP